MTLFETLTIIRNRTKGCWSVCLYHKESKRRYWLDVGLDEKYQELTIDWNQYIFYLTDPDDIDRKEFQENCDNFEAACETIYSILETEGEVFMGEDGEYYLKNEVWEEKTWNV